MNCLQCGSSKLMDHCILQDRGDSNIGQEIELVAYRKPSALIFKDPVKVKVKNLVCENCGFIMLGVGKADINTLKQARNSE